MKTIKYINTFAILFPILLGLLGIIINDSAGDYIAYALYSTMLTGFLQVVLGLILFLRDPKNQQIIIYLIGVILFFTLWYLNATLLNSNKLTYLLFAVAPTLAVYLSAVIYKKDKL